MQLVIRLMGKTTVQASDYTMEASQSLARRRHRLNHADVRSMTERRARITKSAGSERLTISIVRRYGRATAASSFGPACPPSANSLASVGYASPNLTSRLFLVHFEREFSGLEKPSGKELEMKKSRYTDEQIAFALKPAHR
ncbi:hypothetical protein HMP09_2688 [Sphingomonas sp. HMP9]|nr:hypothetical protein HMP09_2688 [Sphingomonas sp. HMP9]